MTTTKHVDTVRAALWRAVALTLADPRFRLSETRDVIAVAEHVDWMLSEPVAPLLRILLKSPDEKPS